MINLKPHELEIVRAILQEIIPARQVMLFGSRTTEKIKRHSDIDLCVMGDVPLTTDESADLREAFSESLLDMKVDIVDWASTSPEFQKIIAKQAVPIFP